MQPAFLKVNPIENGQQSIDPLSAGRASLRLEALGLMTAGIVHDLGNIMQILSGTVDVLDQHPAIRTTRALQPTIHRAVMSLDRASALIKTILSFAQEADDSSETVDIAMCLEKLAPLLRWIGKSDVRVNIHVAAGVPTIECSRPNLENALLNLALNARDAMPTGGTLSITAAPSSDLAQVTGVVLRVSDTGCGMAPETIARAFEPFFTTKSNERGTGLGLAMVRRFAQEAGGCVSIESKPALGTTVTLRLPQRSTI